MRISSHYGKCHLCHTPISPGDRIEKRGGQWVHVHAGRTLGHELGLDQIRILREKLAGMT